MMQLQNIELRQLCSRVEELIKERKYGPQYTVYAMQNSEVTDIWMKAFRYYNENNTKRLGMNCMPCYYKVYEFIFQQVKKLPNDPAAVPQANQ